MSISVDFLLNAGTQFHIVLYRMSKTGSAYVLLQFYVVHNYQQDKRF